MEERLQLRKYSTSGSGNSCFLHALLGKYQNGTYTDQDSEIHRSQLITYTTDYLRKVNNGQLDSDQDKEFLEICYACYNTRDINEICAYFEEEFRQNRMLDLQVLGPMASMCFSKNFIVYDEESRDPHHFFNVNTKDDYIHIHNTKNTHFSRMEVVKPGQENTTATPTPRLNRSPLSQKSIYSPYKKNQLEPTKKLRKIKIPQREVVFEATEYLHKNKKISDNTKKKYIIYADRIDEWKEKVNKIKQNKGGNPDENITIEETLDAVENLYKKGSISKSEKDNFIAAASGIQDITQDLQELEDEKNDKRQKTLKKSLLEFDTLIKEVEDSYKAKAMLSSEKDTAIGYINRIKELQIEVKDIIKKDENGAYPDGMTAQDIKNKIIEATHEIKKINVKLDQLYKKVNKRLDSIYNNPAYKAHPDIAESNEMLILKQRQLQMPNDKQLSQLVDSVFKIMVVVKELEQKDKKTQEDIKMSAIISIIFLPSILLCFYYMYKKHENTKNIKTTKENKRDLINKTNNHVDLENKKQEKGTQTVKSVL